MFVARNGKKFQGFDTNQDFETNRLLTLLGQYVCFQKKKNKIKSNIKKIKKTSHNQKKTKKTKKQ